MFILLICPPLLFSIHIRKPVVIFNRILGLVLQPREEGKCYCLNQILSIAWSTLPSSGEKAVLLQSVQFKTVKRGKPSASETLITPEYLMIKSIRTSSRYFISYYYFNVLFLKCFTVLYQDNTKTSKIYQIYFLYFYFVCYL